MKRFTLADLPANAQAEALRQLHPHIGHAAFYPNQGGPHNVLQKQQDAFEGTADNGPDETEEDGALHPRYRIRVTLLVSDNRRRDADGALSSLMDSLVRAVGRLNPVGAGDSHKGSPRKQRPRGRKPSD